MNRKLSASATVYACFARYIVQAIVNNFAPLLFLTFQSSFGIMSLLHSFYCWGHLGVVLLSTLFFALAGDVGCGAGPTFVGTLAGVFGEDLRPAFICAVIFPILMILALVLYKKSAVSK